MHSICSDRCNLQCFQFHQIAQPVERKALRQMGKERDTTKRSCFGSKSTQSKQDTEITWVCQYTEVKTQYPQFEAKVNKKFS